MTAAQPPAAPPTVAPVDWQRESGWALLAYLAVGFGVFILVSRLAALVLPRPITIVTSSALYLINFLCFAGTAFVLGKLRRHLSWTAFGFRRFNPAWLVLALTLAVAVLPARGLAALLAERLSGSNFSDLQFRADLMVPSGPLLPNFILTLLGAGLLAPVAEEMFFRGLIHRWFSARFGFWPAIFLSSAIFAAGHADSSGVVASAFVLGLVLAAVYDRGRSLWLNIAVHASNNCLAVILLYATLALKLPLS